MTKKTESSVSVKNHTRSNVKVGPHTLIPFKTEADAVKMNHQEWQDAVIAGGLAELVMSRKLVATAVLK